LNLAHPQRNFCLIILLAAGTGIAVAQPDYAPALWNQAYTNHWYTSGNGHFFCVIHDMEGYYEATISYFQQSNTQASIYYCVNSLQNGSDSLGHAENNPNDAPAGQITQMVREKYWAWHVLCWNTYMFGTEHEGFVNSPAWYSEAMYQASALLQQHLCNTYGIAKDRNHIIGHDEWQNPAWTNWMAANWPAINTTCNNHTDPGPYWDWNHFMSLITGAPSPPSIGVQPLNRSVDPGATVTFSVSAVGDLPLSYQWQMNGAHIAGATGSTYKLVNVQPANAAAYSVFITNNSGSATSSNAVLVVNPQPVLQTVFVDNFDVDSSADWNLFQASANNISDFTTNWAFDYSTSKYTLNGVTNPIPLAPNTTNGTMRGLKLTVNKNDSIAADSGVSLYPKGQSFTGDYVLRFDMWINYNGGSGGGSGSTEFATFGINHTGAEINWGAGTASASDGLWFTVDGEGGAASDYRAYVGNPSGNPVQLAFAASGLTANGAQTDDASDPLYQQLFPSPAYETPGCPGKHWVQGEVSQIGGVISWRMNGTVVAQRTNASTYTSGNIMIGYMDIFPSIANPPQDNYVIFDNVRVLTVVNPPLLVAQPASTVANLHTHATFTAAATGTPALYWQWYSRTGAISGAIASTYTRTNLQPADGGNYWVVVTNAAGSTTSSNAVLSFAPFKFTDVMIGNPSGQLQLNATGAPGIGYALQSSSNLVDWTTIATLGNTNGSIQYSVPIDTSVPGLYFRVSAPQ